MARKRAVDGIQDLIDRTGGPKVKASIVVDQIYAANQHETLYFRHPRGGRAKYLEGPLFEDLAKNMQAFANRLLVRGTNTAREWGGAGRAVKNAVAKNAPLEFGDLRKSAALTVTEGSRVVVNEPPAQKRLNDGELEAKDYMRSLGLGYRE